MSKGQSLEGGAVGEQADDAAHAGAHADALKALMSGSGRCSRKKFAGPAQTNTPSLPLTRESACTHSRAHRSSRRRDRALPEPAVRPDSRRAMEAAPGGCGVPGMEGSRATSTEGAADSTGVHRAAQRSVGGVRSKAIDTSDGTLQRCPAQCSTSLL